jgi:twitching motility protein PilT
VAKIDVYVSSLVKYSARSVVLASGGNVTLRFPTGDRFASQTTAHADLVAMIDEIAPPAVAAGVRSGNRATFKYPYQGRSYVVTIEPSANAWRVSIDPPNLPAAPAAAHQAPETRGPPEPPASPAPMSQPVAPAPVRAPSVPIMVSAAGVVTNIERLLVLMKELGASDLHLSTGSPPCIRLHGEIKPIEGQPVYGAEALMADLLPITPEKNRREFDERNDTDFAHAIPGVARYRANFFRDRRGPGAVFRQIPFTILTPEQLGLPKGVLELCYLTKGLVVVTGPTGSGKSTTLATLVDHVNQNRQDHIITIEDPIEFVHDNKKCLVNQREVHSHTRSFKDALRAALREDPDIVLVGEMRDLETIAIAVETAETGHLVFGTLHTTTAPSTLDRIIDQFPADRQDQIRQMLAESLRGVIAQTLCKKVGGGRIAAYEILIGSSAVSNLIREKKTFQLFSLMQTGRAQGMVTMNDSLMELVKKNLVEPREAYMKSVNKAEFKNALGREGIKLDLV